MIFEFVSGGRRTPEWFPNSWLSSHGPLADGACPASERFSTTDLRVR